MVFAPLAEKFMVDDIKLKRMGVDLLGSFGVCDILREYGWDPEDVSASESLDRKLIAMGNITGNVFNLFYGFDSPYHNADHNQKKHIYYGNAAGATGPLARSRPQRSCAETQRRARAHPQGISTQEARRRMIARDAIPVLACSAGAAHKRVASRIRASIRPAPHPSAGG